MSGSQVSGILSFSFGHLEKQKAIAVSSMSLEHGRRMIYASSPPSLGFGVGGGLCSNFLLAVAYGGSVELELSCFYQAFRNRGIWCAASPPATARQEHLPNIPGACGILAADVCWIQHVVRVFESYLLACLLRPEDCERLPQPAVTFLQTWQLSFKYHALLLGCQRRANPLRGCG